MNARRKSVNHEHIVSGFTLSLLDVIYYIIENILIANLHFQQRIGFG